MNRSAICATVFLLASCAGDLPTTGDLPANVASTRGAAAAGGDTPVTTTVADADLTIAPALQIRSDGLGAYKNASTLTSVIQSIGAWVLDSYSPRNATRTLYLDFSQPIAGSGPNGGNPVGLPSALYKVYVISKCNLYGTSMLTMAPGTTMPCPVHIGNVYSGGVKYAIQMNPRLSSADVAYPETNYANITCVYPSSGTGACSQWTITPSGTYTAADGSTKSRNVAKLLKFVTSKGTTTTLDQGDFYLSFRIGVTAP